MTMSLGGRIDPVRVLRSAAPVIVLVALVAGLAVADPSFLELDSLRALADSSSAMLLLAIGVTGVVLCGGIDLSVAALASLCSVLFAQWVPHLGIWAAIPVIAVATVAGAVQGAFHVFTQTPSFIVTLGGMALWSGLALTISGATTISVSDETVTTWTQRLPLGVPAAFLAALIVAGLIGSVGVFTPAGRWMRAIGTSEPAALLAGVPVATTKIAAFAVSGGCAGAAAVVMVSRGYSGAPRLADSLLLPAVAAIVVGGTAITGGHGGIGRTVVGAMVVAVLRVGLSVVDIDQAWENVIYGLIVIAAVALTIDRSRLSVLK